MLRPSGPLGRIEGAGRRVRPVLLTRMGTRYYDFLGTYVSHNQHTSHHTYDGHDFLSIYVFSPRAIHALPPDFASKMPLFNTPPMGSNLRHPVFSLCKVSTPI